MFWYFGKSKKSLFTLSLSKGTRGFSLLELTVVIAIFLIITAVVMTNIPNFREKSSLDLTVSEVATYIRGAQVYGASQKGLSSYYSVHLTKGLTDFCLLSSNKSICGSNSNQYEEKYIIDGFKIGSFLENGVENPERSAVDIVFKSNNYSAAIGTQLEPVFYSDYNPANPGTGRIMLNYLDIKIVSIKDSGNSYCVRVYSNGQITPAQCGV